MNVFELLFAAGIELEVLREVSWPVNLVPHQLVEDGQVLGPIFRCVLLLREIPDNIEQLFQLLVRQPVHLCVNSLTNRHRTLQPNAPLARTNEPIVTFAALLRQTSIHASIRMEEAMR